MSGTKLIERLENELVAQTAALDSLLNPGSKRGRKQAELLFPDSQVPLLPSSCLHTAYILTVYRCTDVCCFSSGIH